MQAFRVRVGSGRLAATAAPAPHRARHRRHCADAPLALPDKPSIAVLPFQNMSGDPEQEYFTDGITEDIITELSRFRSLFVIARNSSFSYKGKSPDIRQVGRELGVRYVLEGSIRKVGESNSSDRPAHRHVDRQPHLGGALRPRAGGRLCRSGGADAKHRARDRAADFRSEVAKARGGVPTASAPTRSLSARMPMPGTHG